MGPIVAGIVSSVTLIAASVTAAVALSQSIQTARYVNTLTGHVTAASGTRETIDNTSEQKVKALCDMIVYLGEEVQGLKLRHTLNCHAEYEWVCVTDEKYIQ